MYIGSRLVRATGHITVGRGSSSPTSFASSFRVSVRRAVGDTSATLLKLDSLQTQGVFLTTVVIQALQGTQVEVVTSPRGFHKSTCAAAMASEEHRVQVAFGTTIPSVKLVGDKLRDTKSGYELFDALLQVSSEIKVDGVQEAVSTAGKLAVATRAACTWLHSDEGLRTSEVSHSPAV
jgi:hypothetical protein